MLKVIIVDDEILIRVGAKSCLDWEQHGFEVVGLAEDGAKALALVEKTNPDLVLTDIKMPNMDGLELIEALRTDYPQIKVIVLSCYNEMDYVKRAMKFGAEDYLLKLSLQPETLLETLHRVKETLEQQRDEQLVTDKLAKKGIAKKQILKDNLYQHFIEGSLEAEDLVLALNKMEIEINFGDYWVACCRINSLRGPSFRNIVEEVLAEYCQFDLAELEKGFYLLLMTKAAPMNIADVCAKVRNTVENYLNTVVSFGVSRQGTSSGQLKEKYLQACSALDYMFYDSPGRIRQFNEKLSFIKGPIRIDVDFEKELLDQIESLDTEGAGALSEEFFRTLNAEKSYAPETVKYAIIEIIYALNSLVKKYSLPNTDGSFELKQNISTILGMETLEDLKVWLKGYLSQMVAALSAFKLEIVRPEIARIKAYLLKHIDENIPLEEAAQISNLSKAYFSTVFKQEIGESYTDFSNRVKMEKARELICDFGLKCYEAAERVGIFDQSYFSKLFKKYLGESPSMIKAGKS